MTDLDSTDKYANVKSDLYSGDITNESHLSSQIGSSGSYSQSSETVDEHVIQSQEVIQFRERYEPEVEFHFIHKKYLLTLLTLV